MKTNEESNQCETCLNFTDGKCCHDSIRTESKIYGIDDFLDKDLGEHISPAVRVDVIEVGVRK